LVDLTRIELVTS